MFGKLMKHEMKESRHICLLLIGAVVLVTLFGSLGVQLPIRILKTGYMEEIWYVLSIFCFIGLFFIYVSTIGGVAYVLQIFFGYRFYKTMYSSQGYLTHTLPVTPKQLFWSKTLCGAIWSALISISIFLSVLIVFSTVLIGVGVEVGTMEEIITAIKGIFEVVVEDVNPVLAVFMTLNMIFSLIYGVLAPVIQMITLFGALTIGQLFRKFRAVMGIVIFFVIGSVQGMLSYIVALLISILAEIVDEVTYSSWGGQAFTIGSSSVAYLITIIVAAIIYFVSIHILEHKFDLE